MTHKISNKAVLQALHTYGTHFDQWPDQALAHYVKNQPELKRHIEREAMLDNELDSSKAPLASESLKSQILKAAQAVDQASSTNNNNVTRLSDHQRAKVRAIPTSRFSPFMRMAALFLICATVGGSFWAMNNSGENNSQYVATVDTETNAWMGAADDLGMADVFLWVETGSTES